MQIVLIEKRIEYREIRRDRAQILPGTLHVAVENLVHGIAVAEIAVLEVPRKLRFIAQGEHLLGVCVRKEGVFLRAYGTDGIFIR